MRNNFSTSVKIRAHVGVIGCRGWLDTQRRDSSKSRLGIVCQLFSNRAFLLLLAFLVLVLAF